MVIFLFSISAASAHDNTTNDIGICDEPTDQVTLEIDEIGNFTDLNNEISKITAGGNYTLKKDYTYSPNDSDYVNGINITKDNVVIDGNGHTINGAGKARIFNILSNNVTLKNINFINGHSSENGGAIYVENAISNCKINSTFINNSAYNGGAIYFNGAITNATINGHFEGNTAERAGGAIYVKGTSRNNTFACEFYNNTANKASGGAIFFYNLAENNQFESVLRYNHGIYGAGIFFYNKANNNRFKCDFRFNVAESCGGAIFFHNTTNNNSFSGYFINNTALGNVDDVNGNGGAITFKDTSSNCIFTCDFINNTAAKNGGGVNVDFRMAEKLLTEARDAGFYDDATRLLNEIAERRQKKRARAVYSAATEVYRRGEIQKAIKLRAIAANMGSARAEYVLGCHFEYGDGLPQDIEKAKYYYKRAREHGFRDILLEMKVGFLRERRLLEYRK